MTLERDQRCLKLQQHSLPFLTPSETRNGRRTSPPPWKAAQNPSTALPWAPGGEPSPRPPRGVVCQEAQEELPPFPHAPRPPATMPPGGRGQEELRAWQKDADLLRGFSSDRPLFSFRFGFLDNSEGCCFFSGFFTFNKRTMQTLRAMAGPSSPQEGRGW